MEPNSSKVNLWTGKPQQSEQRPGGEAEQSSARMGGLSAIYFETA